MPTVHDGPSGGAGPLDFVSACPPFDVLPPPALARIAPALEISFVTSGSCILSSEGPPSTYLYIVGTGTVRLEKDGRPLMVVEPGEVFGHASLYWRAPRLRRDC